MTATVYKAWTNVYSSIVSPITSTRFMEKGQLTPEEFVAAGDKLVAKCPNWKWMACEDGQEAIHKQMPRDKRYLVMAGARCEKRASDLTQDAGGEEETEDGWTTTHVDHKVAGMDDALEMEDAKPSKPDEQEDIDEDDIPDMDMDDDCGIQEDEEDPAAVITDSVVPARKYDLHLLYDNYHYTPRVYLKGYDENGTLLTNEAMHEDIYHDYADKTATIETHPYTGASMISIHPCRHAETMKRMVDKLKEAHDDRLAAEGREGEGEQFGVSPDMALFLFLKFISSVIPTVDYDFTASVDMH
eukprot:TRINITY_DN4745_c0_g1_i1.p2 TRINITY_DN4745_c0_g1~~TRINITY_DN4745_c0_g1_i1.p2  ORF type:complete len:343 (+),score=127.13 TRINITY_DN4745_c0_g1_i1:132-1031(+)